MKKLSHQQGEIIRVNNKFGEDTLKPFQVIVPTSKC